jgi:hypothetical protein
MATLNIKIESPKGKICKYKKMVRRSDKPKKWDRRMVEKHALL